MKKISPQHPPKKKFSEKIKSKIKPIPTEQQIYDFVKNSKELVNFTSIAKHFKIHKVTASALVYSLVSKHKIKLEKFGSSIAVRIIKK